MTLFRRTSFLLTVALLSFLQISAAGEESRYYVTTENGLSNSSINDIYKDKNGLLWLCTWNGLNVYDGSSVVTFKSDPGDAGTLLDNITTRIVPEGENHLWVVSELGLNRLDLRTGKFRRFPVSSKKSSLGEISLAVCEGGSIFCSAPGTALTEYDKDRDCLTAVSAGGEELKELFKIADAGGRKLLAVGTDGGVSVIRYNNDKNGRAEVERTDRILPPSSHAYYLIEGDQSVYIIGKRLAWIYDKAKATLADSLSFSGEVSFSAFSPEGDLYVLSDRSKVYSLDFRYGVAKEIELMSRDNLLSFCFGEQGIIWLAIDGIGLEAVYDNFSSLRKISSKDIFGRNCGAVSAIVQCRSGKIYASVLGAGIFVMGEDGSVEKILSSSPDAGNIFSMVNAPGDNILIGVRNALYLLDTKSDRFSLLYKFNTIPSTSLYRMYYDNARKTLWAGTLGQGVLKMEVSGEGGSGTSISNVTSYTLSDSPKSLSSNTVMEVAPCGNDKLWIGTMNGGLCMMDIATGECERYLPDGGNGSFPSLHARVVYQDAENSVWVGTSDGIAHGIKDGDSGSWSFSVTGEKDGLCDNTVNALLNDDQGNIWASTNNGITMLSPSEGKIENHDNNEYLQGREFYLHSCLKARDGEMYFGGVNGLNIFQPESMLLRKFTPKVIIRSFRVRLDTPINVSNQNTVKLKHNENFFNVYFSAVEFIGNSGCEYAYKLEGFNNDWTVVGTGMPATFTNVPPGKYVFRVKSTNGDKVWCDNEEDLSVIISKPWYKTDAAYAGYLAMAIVLILLTVKMVRNRQKQEILLTKEMLEKQAQKETYDAKLDFFTNVAHEFGTPLTLISCSGELLASQGANSSKASKYIHTINDNAARMQKLIQELLEFRKVESGKYNPVYTFFDPAAMIESILEEFSDIGEENDISLRLDIPEKGRKIVSDASALEKIFLNIISNAYKYTPQGGYVAVSMDYADNGLHCVISNKSKGLTEEKLARVFDRFVILDNLEQQMGEGKKTRNGIGMALTQSLVQLLGGDISVRSEMGKSVTFEFRVPFSDESKAQHGAAVEGNQLHLGKTPSVSAADRTQQKSSALQKPGLPLVLIVDDEEEICQLVDDILGDEYNVESAGNGVEAVEILRREHVDLVITDINMPEMDGIELIKTLKGNILTKYIPIVVLAVKTDTFDEIKSYDIGSDAFISKPFLPEQLVAVVRKIFSSRMTMKDYYSSASGDSDIFKNIKSASEREFIQKAIRAVEKKMTEDLSPAALASSLNISEMTLYRRLKTNAGMSTGEFIRTVKLNYAATLLRTTDRPVKEIMYDCGFTNKSWFYRKFSETYHCTPNKYRKN